MFVWLCLAGFWAFFWIPPFWVLPTATLTASAAAVAVGVINMCANLAGLFGSPVVGAMKDAGPGRPGVPAVPGRVLRGRAAGSLA